MSHSPSSPDHPSPSPHDPYDPDLSPTEPSASHHQRKRHICQICNRAFTTSGHLSRHTRIHTGERNHKCPYPGCETRCSRQDNLQQHYRIHLSPGSRRHSGSATRAAMSRATSDRPRSARKRSRNESQDPASPAPPSPAPSPPLDPPPLTPAYQALVPAAAPPAHASPTDIPEPPDTPPPLAQAYPTLPPPSAPVYAQLPLPERDAGHSARSSPEASYNSPVSYPHAALAAAAAAPYPQYEEHAYPASQDSRASSSFGRATGDDPRWAYPQQQQQSYPSSESDRYSPASPVAHVQYAAPASPGDAYSVGTHRASGPGGYALSQQESVGYYNQFQPRQSSNAALVTASAHGPALAQHQQHQQQQQQSSNRHSIAHISNPVVRQHSPASSASPAASHPSTPGGAYASYVPSAIGSYAESPPGSASPSAPPSSTLPLPSGLVGPAAAAYSYDTSTATSATTTSNSLAGAGYALPLPQATQDYGRILPSLSPAHARDPSSAFAYGAAGAYGSRRASPPPVLAPIHVRRDAGAAAAAAQPRRSSGGHAFSYAPHAHAPTYASSSYGSAAGGSSAGYYYQHSHQTQQQQGQEVAHGDRDPSPDSAGTAAEQYLELHQPQGQRGAHTGHHHSGNHSGSHHSAHHSGHHDAHGHSGGTHHDSHAQYMQTGVGLLGGGGAAQHAGYHPASAWRAEEYHRGRSGLVTQ